MVGGMSRCNTAEAHKRRPGLLADVWGPQPDEFSPWILEATQMGSTHVGFSFPGFISLVQNGAHQNPHIHAGLNGSGHHGRHGHHVLRSARELLEENKQLIEEKKEQKAPMRLTASPCCHATCFCFPCLG